MKGNISNLNSRFIIQFKVIFTVSLSSLISLICGCLKEKNMVH